MNWIKESLIGLAKLVLGITILVALVIGFTAWKKYPLETYCNDLEVGADFDVAVKLAHESGLKTPFLKNDTKNRLMIFNHRAPYFRFACEAKFKDGELISVSSFGAD